MRDFIKLIENLVSRNPHRISTRLPTGKTATENPYEDDLTIDIEAAKQDPKSFEHNVNLIRGYHALPKNLQDAPHDEIANHFTDHLRDNILWLHDKMPEHIRNRARLWYEGANRLAMERAENYGLSPSATAAVYAALSPQKSWHENVSIGDRVMEIYLRKGDSGWSDRMEETARKIWSNEKNRIIHSAIQGKRLVDLIDIDHKAAWIRTYDEAHNPTSYQTVEPEGRLGRPYTNRAAHGGGTKNPTALAIVRWGSLAEISKAICSLDAGDDISRISELMGERHKVRNFYNNIIDPNGEYGDVTIDTHAVAAGLLHPLGGNTPEVAHNFHNSLPNNVRDKMALHDFKAAKGSKVTGVRGTYPFYADAYRKAAKERGILPREMQSITWEAVKGLFHEKGQNKAKNLAEIRKLWQQYQHGELSAEDVRNIVHDLSGGIQNPDWADEEEDGDDRRD
jgi:hypothetical protein